jgi:hypothetical protein
MYSNNINKNFLVMKRKKAPYQKKYVDHKKTNRNAVITALMLTLIIITSAAAGLIIILSSAKDIAAGNEMVAAQTVAPRQKKRFIVKLYDYIAYSQAEIHNRLSEI